jgi:hypothetical protein
MVPAYPRETMERRVCEAVEAGATLDRIARRPGWPSRCTVWRWARDSPAFARRLGEAQAWRRGMAVSARAGPQFDEARAQAFLLAVRRGQAVRDLVRTPGQPHRDLLNRWKRERPDFAAELEAAVRFSAEERPQRWDRYDEAVADEIVVRLIRGEPMSRVLADPDLPCKIILRRWRRKRPDFDAALKTARLAGHRKRMGLRRRLTPELHDQILTRLTEGRSLRQVSFLPGMPHVVTMYGWKRRDPDFADMVRWATEEGRIGKVIERGAAALAGLVPSPRLRDRET